MRFLVLIWRRLDRSVGARILIPAALLFAATVAGMILLAISLHVAGLGRVQSKRAELLARMVATSLAPALVAGSDEDTSTLLRELAAQQADVAALSLLDAKGTVISSSVPALIGTRPVPNAAGIDRLTHVVGASDADPEMIVMPVSAEAGCVACESGHPALGWLNLSLSPDLQKYERHGLLRALIPSAALAFATFVLLAAWLFRREAVRPLRQLVDAMRRAADGDPDVMADEGRADEIGIAARRFNETLAALRKTRKELEAFYQQGMQRADRFAAVGELAAALAHEIRNPLAGLSGALELLAEDLKHVDSQAELVNEMRHQVGRLTGIMDGLLHFARPPRVDLRRTNVNESVRKTLFLLGKQGSGRSHLSIKSQLTENLPPALADPSQLEQVLLNLGLNATQALAGRKGTITVRTDRDGDMIKIEIADDGPGIPESVRGSVFQPFFTTKKTGTGLGLAISARIVGEHGGQLDLRCPPEGGAVFTVSLRVATNPADERAA